MPQGSYTCEGDGGERRGRVAASLKGWEPFSYLRGSCTSVRGKKLSAGNSLIIPITKHCLWA